MPNEPVVTDRPAAQQANPFGSRELAARTSGALVEVEQQRAIAETQAAMIIAKRFPRSEAEAMDKILQACTRPSLAEAALYSYSRGGTDITGPSIRLAEAIAQNWKNLQFGIRELDQRGGESEVEAFCWDVENNTKQLKVFRVPHVRYTKAGSKALTDPRDVYEMVANQGARRLRACILGIIPGDVIDAAVKQCEVTLNTKAEVTPERLASLVEKFGKHNVTKEMIEKRIQRRLDAMTPALLVQMGKIYNSLEDGMSTAVDWFEVAPGTAAEAPTSGVAGAKAAAAKTKAAETGTGTAAETKPRTPAEIVTAIKGAIERALQANDRTAADLILDDARTLAEGLAKNSNDEKNADFMLTEARSSLDDKFGAKK